MIYTKDGDVPHECRVMVIWIPGESMSTGVVDLLNCRGLPIRFYLGLNRSC